MGSIAQQFEKMAPNIWIGIDFFNVAIDHEILGKPADIAFQDSRHSQGRFDSLVDNGNMEGFNGGVLGKRLGWADISSFERKSQMVRMLNSFNKE